MVEALNATTLGGSINRGCFLWRWLAVLQLLRQSFFKRAFPTVCGRGHFLPPYERRLLLADKAQACVVRLFPINRSGIWNGYNNPSRLVRLAVGAALNGLGLQLKIFMNGGDRRFRLRAVALYNLSESTVRFRLRHETLFRFC